MYFGKNEKSIIEKFYKSLSEIGGNDILELLWETGKITAVFDTCFDDFDENNEKDEFTSFVFKSKNMEGVIPVDIGENDLFIVNYHNFPKQILLNGKEIN